MNYRMPAEWEQHEACWIAWPSHADLWGEDLEGVQAEFVELCRAIAYAPRGSEGEKLRVLAPNAARFKQAKDALSSLGAEVYLVEFGDIWLRDTGPIFVEDTHKQPASACFRFNGWGGKYNLPFDSEVSHQIAKRVDFPVRNFDWVLEGGSVEVDGQGTCLTSEQCLLNPNRNPGLSRSQIEERLKEALGVQKVLWLREGLLNDHTDGHIDTIARFVAPGEVFCMSPNGPNDPNAKVLNEIASALSGFIDARGRRLKVHQAVAPVLREEGKVLPASYTNFYISNHSVVVPTYGLPTDQKAVSTIAKLFPKHRTFGLSAKVLLRGGGAFHCITQQQPALGGVRG